MARTIVRPDLGGEVCSNCRGRNGPCVTKGDWKICGKCWDRPESRSNRGGRRVQIRHAATLLVRTRRAELGTWKRSDGVDLQSLAANLIKLGERLRELAADKPDTAETVELLAAAGLDPNSVISLLEGFGY